MDKQIAISIENLCKSYGTNKVLKNVSLQVHKGELFGFIGKNGAGKSTTVDCLIGIKAFERGRIVICGHDVLKAPMEAKKAFGYVASEPCCYANMTGMGFFIFIANVYSVDEKIFRQRLGLLLNQFLFDKKDLGRRISTYSHGMMQKVCLIASLLHDPQVWILDEPTVGLDIMTVDALKAIMKSRTKSGKTVFFTSHNIEFISTLCDKVAIINNGQVVGVHDLKNEPQFCQKLSKDFFEMHGGAND